MTTIDCQFIFGYIFLRIPEYVTKRLIDVFLYIGRSLCIQIIRYKWNLRTAGIYTKERNTLLSLELVWH